MTVVHPLKSTIVDVSRDAQDFASHIARIEFSGRTPILTGCRLVGKPIFFAVMYLLFQGIFIFGQPIQGGIAAAFTWLREAALVPLLASLPPAIQGLLLDGIYNGVATVAAFVVTLSMATYCRFFIRTCIFHLIFDL